MSDDSNTSSGRGDGAADPSQGAADLEGLDALDGEDWEDARWYEHDPDAPPDGSLREMMKDIEQEHGEPPRGGAMKRVALGALFGVIALALVGVVTDFIGIGPFGYRYLRYGTGELHIYNGTPHFAHVEADGITHVVRPFEGVSVEVLGGAFDITTRLQLVEDDTRTDTFEDLETLHLDTREAASQDFIYHVATEQSTCLVVADMTTFYRNSQQNAPELIGFIGKDARLQPLEDGQVIFAPDTLPDKVTSPPLLWLAAIPCEMLAKPEVASGYVNARARDRRRRLNKERERQRRIFEQRERGVYSE